MTTVRGQLLEMLKTVAAALGEELRERLVFVGGCTTAIFITDPVTLEDVRATDDVDLIVDLAGFAEWAQLLELLRQKHEQLLQLEIDGDDRADHGQVWSCRLIPHLSGKPVKFTMPCQKLGISFYHFLGDRLGLGVAGQPIPPLSALGTTAN